jgi:hypothetical protein
MNPPFHTFGKDILIINGLWDVDPPHIFSDPYELAEDMVRPGSSDQCIDLFLCTPAVKVSNLQGFTRNKCHEDVPEDACFCEPDHGDGLTVFAQFRQG